MLKKREYDNFQIDLECIYVKEREMRFKMTRRGGVITSAMVCSSLVMGNASCQYESVAAAYAGWYVGCGISYQYTKGDIVLNDNAGQVAGAVGGAHMSLFNTNVRRTGAALTFGYGDFITGNCYLGGEINLDITGSKHTKNEELIIRDAAGDPLMNYGSTEVKTRGLVPTVALRFGGYIQSLDCLFYARVGFTFLNNKFENNAMPGQGFGSQRVTPIVGLGFEKTIFDGCTMRIEGDYRFPADKKRDGLWKLDDDDGVLNTDRIDGYNASVKNKVRGYVVRVVCVYHF